MAVIIPNVGDTGPTNERYITLNQAEPDSLDFEALSNSGRSGVLSGCAVTTQSNTTSVAVESGTIIINGVRYTVAGGTVSLPAAPVSTNNERFDLVIARVFSGTASVVVIQGYADNGGIRFPNTRNTTNLFDSSTDIDFDTDVVLASVYRNLSNTVTAAHITDKRVMLSSSIYDGGASAPSDSHGSTGSLFFRNNRTTTDTGSGVYVKNSVGEWLELAQNTGYQIPVGGIIAWPSRNAVPTGWTECNGQFLSTTTYAELYAVLGTVYGSGTGTFKVPDLNGKMIRGNTTVNDTGTNIGDDNPNVPLLQHRHDHQHSHSMTHYHDVNHSHDVSVSVNSSNHSHNIGHGHNTSATSMNGAASQATATSGDHFHYGWFVKTFAGSSSPNTGYNVEAARPYSATNEGTINPGDAVNGSWTNNFNRSAYRSRITGAIANSWVANNQYANEGGHSHIIYVQDSNATSGNSGGGNTSGHTHSATGGANTGAKTTSGLNNKGAINSGGTAANSTGSLGNTDRYTANEGTAGATMSVVPASVQFRWIIRHSGDINTVGTQANILSEAREEVVTVELVEDGATLSNALVARWRMPWTAALTNARLSLDSGNNVTTATTVTIADSTNTITSDLEIAVGSDSSHGTTPTLSNNTSIATNELLTFTISGATTTDTGPLVATLYFTRED